MQPKVQTDGAVFVVHRQPIALDRVTVHDVRPDTAGWFCYIIHVLISVQASTIVPQLVRIVKVVSVRC